MTIFVCFTITFVHVHAHAFLQCCPPWRQHRILYVHISVHDVANACQIWHTYWQDIVMKNGSPDMLSLVYVTINTCRGENNEEHDNLLPHMMALKTTLKPHISQILICKTNMLSPITFSRSTGYQPKQRLQLSFDSFLWNAMSTSFLYGIHALSHTKCNVHIIFLWVQVSPTSAANSTWKWPTWHCQHIICLREADMSFMCPSLGIMENHVSCNVT